MRRGGRLGKIDNRTLNYMPQIDERSGTTEFVGVREVTTLFMEARHASAAACVILLFFVGVWMVIFWPVNAQTVAQTAGYWIVVLFVTLVFWLASFGSSRALSFSPNTDFSGTSWVQIFTRGLYWRTDSGQLRTWGVLRVGDQGLSVLIKLPWAKIESASRVNLTDVMVHKRSNYGPMKRFLKLDVIVLRMVTPADAQRFLDLCRSYLAAHPL